MSHLLAAKCQEITFCWVPCSGSWTPQAQDVEHTHIFIKRIPWNILLTQWQACLCRTLFLTHISI